MQNDIQPRNFGREPKTEEISRPSNEPRHPENTNKTPAGIVPKDSVLSDESGSIKLGSNPDKKGRRWHFPGYRHWKQLSYRQKIISLVALGLLLIVGTVAAMELFIKEPAEPSVVTLEKKEIPTTKQGRLTGLEIPIEVDAMPVTGVMIENSPDARPQSGLYQAGVVFEAIAEGGITRFLALFHEAKPDYIGPVRSVRPYYLDWVVPFDAPIAHAGGSAKALAQIRSQGIKDIDHGANASTFNRVSSRFAPHNLFTSRDKLLEAHKRRGYDTSEFEGFARKKKETPLEAPTASTITFNISSTNYNSVFTYDKESNSYPRKMAGKAHKDEKTGKTIRPKVVIGMVMSRSQDGIYSVYKTHGKGTVLIFQDGGVTKGVWRKKDRKSEITFTDSEGKTIELNPGQTWIVALASGGQASYSP